MSEPKYTLLFNDQAEPVGVHINAALWVQVQDAVLPMLREACAESPEPEPEFPEPLKDWNDLLAYWDLPYPLEPTVACEACGAQTDDWQADDPRKFRLKAANFGGLVTFECQQCRARISKNHFKDGVKSKTVPYAE